MYAQQNDDYIPYVGDVQWGQPWTMPHTPEQMLLGSRRDGGGAVPSVEAFVCPVDPSGRQDWYVWQPGDPSETEWPWPGCEDERAVSYTWSEHILRGMFYDVPGTERWQAIPFARAPDPENWGVLADGNAHIFNAWLRGNLAVDGPEGPDSVNRRLGQSHIGGGLRSVNVLYAPGDVRVVERRFRELRKVRSSPIGADPYATSP